MLITKECSIGLLYKERKVKSIEKLKELKANYSTWLLEDKSKQSLFKSTSLCSLTSFLTSNFDCYCSKTNQLIISIDANWKVLTMKKQREHKRASLSNDSGISVNTNSGDRSNLILRNKIIKLSNDNINLRTFALKCTFRLLLSGECYFFIFSRATTENDFNDNTLVCFISKEIESPRIFVNYAVFEPLDNHKLHLHVMKKQEVPNQTNHNNFLDVTEVHFNFIDNGDNNCILLFPYQKPYHRNFIADFYCPQYDLCNLYIAVGGDLISIKEMTVTSSETKISLSAIKCRQTEMNKSACCLCF